MRLETSSACFLKLNFSGEEKFIGIFKRGTLGLRSNSCRIQTEQLCDILIEPCMQIIVKCLNERMFPSSTIFYLNKEALKLVLIIHRIFLSRGGGYFRVKRIGMTFGNPRKLP